MSPEFADGLRDAGEAARGVSRSRSARAGHLNAKRTGFYDRRNDPRNFLIDAFVAILDEDGTFKNKRVTKSSFAAIIGEDLVVNPAYMGDYIGIARDSTGRHNGVIMAWGDNSLGDPNILFAKRSGHED